MASVAVTHGAKNAGKPDRAGICKLRPITGLYISIHFRKMKIMRLFISCVVLCFASQLQAGDCGNAATEARVNLITREPIQPVRNILAKIGAVARSSCTGGVRVERVRVVSSMSACSGAAAKRTTCGSPRAATCAGAVQAQQAYGLGIEAAAPQPAVRSAGLAQQKAEQQANEGRIRHVGGGFGGGIKEGVGYSSRSAQEAIEKCCFYGQYTPREIGVARGSNGWYAAVIY